MNPESPPPPEGTGPGWRGAVGPAAMLWLTAASLLLFLTAIGQRDLWAPDEPRYAEVAQEMVRDGEWLIPHLNGKVYAEKPPLFFWVIAALSLPTGAVSEITARLPSVLSAVAVLWLTFLLGRRLLGERTALVGAVVFAFTVKVYWQATWAQIDMMLTVFIVSALLCFHRADAGVGSRRKNFILFYLFLALGTLTKGPVGFLVPLFVAALFLLIQGEIRSWHRRGDVLAHVIGLLVFLLLVLAWVVPAAVIGSQEFRGSEPYLDTVVGRFVGRIFGSETSGMHARPPWYYLRAVAFDFVPWILFLPGAVAHALSTALDSRRRSATFLLVWVLTVLLMFSFATGKRGIYILSIYPPLALIVGKLFADVRDRLRVPKPRWLVSLPFVVWGAFFVFIGVGFIVFICFWREILEIVSRRAEIPAEIGLEIKGYLNETPLALRLGLCGAWIAAGLLLIRPPARSSTWRLRAVVGAIAATVLYSNFYVLPYVDHFKSARPFCERVLTQSKPSDRFGILFFQRAEYVFYTGRKLIRINHDEELLERFQKPGRLFVFARRRDFEPLLERFPLPIYVVEEAQVGSRAMVCFSNRPPRRRGETPEASS